MDTFDLELARRLARLAEAVPVEAVPEPHRGHVPGRRLSGVLAGVTAAILIAGATVGGLVLFGVPTGHPGLFGPGRPLYCSGIERMTPPEAAAWLAAHGYVVTWQIEDVDAPSSRQSTVPPMSGYIIDGVLKGNQMTLVVEVGQGAQRVNPPPCQ